MIARCRKSVENAKILVTLLRRRKRFGYSYRPAGVSLGAVVTFVLAVAVSFRFLDAQVAARARHLPDSVFEIFSWVTQIGSSRWYIAFSGGVLLLLGMANWDAFSRRIACRFRFFCFWAMALLASVAGGGIAINLLKRSIGRARPVYLESLGSDAFHPFAYMNSFASFPSGHAATSASVAVILIVFFPKQRWLWICLAILAAASRIIIREHYPSDVLAGLAFGAGASWLVLVFMARRGLGFIEDPEAPLGFSPARSRSKVAFSEVIAALEAGLHMNKSGGPAKRPGLRARAEENADDPSS